MRKGSDVILGAWHGGLGDQLQLSTLPEEFYKQQGRETYIFEDAPFRNQEIYDLVWGCNPYIKGKKSGVRNAGDLPEYRINQTCGNWIQDWEIVHGLVPSNIRPKIYYPLMKLPNYKNTILVDLSSVTINHNNTGYGYDLNEVDKIYYALRKSYPDKKFVGVRFKGVNSNQHHPKVDEEVVLDNIFHYCHLINSSYGICCFYSGAMALAAAIQRSNELLKIYCITPPSVYYSDRTQKQGIFYFDYVDYLVTE